jgi:cytoskeletal protein CcmA (bactofilin family)
LSLKDGCVVSGNLHVRRLSVELGATFNGNCKTITEAEFDKLAGHEAAPKAAQTQQARAN